MNVNLLQFAFAVTISGNMFADLFGISADSFEMVLAAGTLLQIPEIPVAMETYIHIHRIRSSNILFT